MNVIESAKKMAEAAGGGWLRAEDAQSLIAQSGTPIDQLLLDLIPLASTCAMPPMSGFQVGAVGQGDSGAIYFGANFEFPTCPLNRTVHAEQATVVNAATHGETGMAKLAVSAAPCGYCRQFLYELDSAQRLDVLLANRPPTKLPDYLPGAFGPGDLGQKGGLLSPAQHQLKRLSTVAGPAADAAFKAAAISYAPYTKAFAGAGLVTRDGKAFSGPYLENAAFNPSLSPLQAAVVAAVLGGTAVADITEAAIVQLDDSKIDHAAAARSVLEKLAPRITVLELLARRV